MSASDKRAREERNRLRAFSNVIMKRWMRRIPVTDQGVERAALEHGLLAIVEATEPCGEECECRAEGFPHGCLRPTRVLTGLSGDPEVSNET